MSSKQKFRASSPQQKNLYNANDMRKVRIKAIATVMRAGTGDAQHVCVREEGGHDALDELLARCVLICVGRGRGGRWGAVVAVGGHDVQQTDSVRGNESVRSEEESTQASLGQRSSLLLPPAALGHAEHCD